jgi:hypothetical protein
LHNAGAFFVVGAQLKLITSRLATTFSKTGYFLIKNNAA